MNRPTEAEPLYRRALAIFEASYGPDHPNVTIGLGNLAGLLADTGREAEALPLARRALAIFEASYGSDHPHAVMTRNFVGRIAQGLKGRPAEPWKENTAPKVGRNKPCPCGSGKKYKHCNGSPASF
jgi:hypothetical protein